MKKNQILKVAALLVLCCTMHGCNKSNEEPVVETRVYGTVFDKLTGEPIRGVEVDFCIAELSLLYSGTVFHTSTSSISGNDGQYDFTFDALPQLPDDLYTQGYAIRAYCDGYETYTKAITIVEGHSYRIDVNLIPR